MLVVPACVFCFLLFAGESSDLVTWDYAYHVLERKSTVYCSMTLAPLTYCLIKCFVLYWYVFLDLFIQFYIPFKIISAHMRRAISRWAKTGEPREKNLAHPQAELGLSHMWPVRGSNPHQTQR